MGLKPFAIRDLPKHCFPLTIEAYGPEENLVWKRTVNPPEGKRQAIDIPGTGPGSVTKIVMRTGDGQVDEYRYDG